MLAEYTGVLVIVAMAVVLIASLLSLQLRRAPHRAFASKQGPFAAASRRAAENRRGAAAKFFRAAIPFSVLGTAALWFQPWGTVFRDLGWWGFAAAACAAVPLAIGCFHLGMKGGFDE